MSEPISVIPLQYAHVGSPTRSAIALRVLALLAWINCVLGFALIVGVQVETVIGTGPCLFFLGISMLVIASRVRSTPYIILATAHCAVCLLFFVLVLRLNWSPRQATVPFGIMSGVYTALSGLGGLWIWHRRKMPGPTLA